MVESTKQAFIERIKTPFWGYFFLAWFYLNWNKVLILAFDASDIETRINKISSYIKFASIYEDTLWYPLTIAFFSSIVMSFLYVPIKWADSYTAALKGEYDFNKDNGYQVAKQKYETEKSKNELEISERELQIKENEQQTLNINLDNLNLEIEEKNKIISELETRHLSLSVSVDNIMSELAEKTEIKRKLEDEIENKENKLGELQNSYINLSLNENIDVNLINVILALLKLNTTKASVILNDISSTAHLSLNKTIDCLVTLSNEGVINFNIKDDDIIDNNKPIQVSSKSLINCLSNMFSNGMGTVIAC